MYSESHHEPETIHVPAFEALQPEARHSGLANVELTKERVCQGESKKDEFTYYCAEKNASEFGLNKKELEYLHSELGLNDQHFQVYSREQGPIGELGDRQVYVLLHGWTANNEIYSDVHMANGHSIVEEILARDPNAVIVSVDGNGFGESQFLNTSKNDSEHSLKNLCSIQGYAAQVDFLITNVLGIEKQPDENGVAIGNKNVRIMGHSMGGATAMTLAMKYGYEHCVAVAPAYFPLKANIKSTLTPEEYDVTPYINFAPPLYRLVSNSVWLGDYFESKGMILRNVSHAAVDRVFNAITPSLMGTTITGDKKEDRRIMAELKKIHAGEMYHQNNSLIDSRGDVVLLEPKLDVVGRTLHNLQAGEDVSALTSEELCRFGDNVTVFTGTKDVLVPDQHILELYRVMMTYAGRNIKSTTLAAGESLEEGELPTDNAVAHASYVSLAHALQTLDSRRQEVGHYGALFASTAPVEVLVA